VVIDITLTLVRHKHHMQFLASLQILWESADPLTRPSHASALERVLNRKSGIQVSIDCTLVALPSLGHAEAGRECAKFTYITFMLPVVYFG